jgi:predicted dehydrogenase
MIISTPHATHFEIAESLVTRGVHVHIDKPLCSTLTQVDELIVRADACHVFLSTHTQRKYMPGQSQLKSYLQKYFSELYHVSGSIWQPLFDDYAGSWRADRTLAAGGILMDSGYHVVDTIVSLLGSGSTQIRDIAALAHSANNRNDSFVTLVFRMGRTVVQVNAFRGTPKALKKEEYQVLGDGGHIALKYTGSGREKTCQTVFWAADGRTRETEDLTLTSSYTFHPLQLFLDALRGNHVARTVMQDNIAVARTTLFILHEAYSRDI